MAAEEETKHPLLAENPDRFSIFPIKHPEIFAHWEKQVNSHWTFRDIPYDDCTDRADFEKLSEPEQKLVEMMLAFFANLDGVVNENLFKNFLEEVQVPELRQCYAAQGDIEATHAVTYASLIENIVTNPDRKAELHTSIGCIPEVKKIGDWAQKWMDPTTRAFEERLIAFACLEGVMFSGAFAIVYWLQSRNMFPALSIANKYIARDEGMHTETAIMAYRMLDGTKWRLPEETVKSIITEAYEVERDFILSVLPVKLAGIDADSLNEYMRFVASDIHTRLGYGGCFPDAKCKLDYVVQMALEESSNMFELKDTNYSTGAISKKTVIDMADDDEF